MWSSLVQWHRDMEQEQWRVLKDPSTAAEIQPYVRRCLAKSLAKLSEIERSQLLEFSLKYRGWRFYAAILKLVILFSIAGLALYAVAPHKGLAPALFVANAVGLAICFVFAVSYFNYRKMVGKTLRFGVILMVCAAIGGLTAAVEGDMRKGKSFDHALQANWSKAVIIGLGAGMFLALPMAMVGAVRNREYQSLTAQLEYKAERERAARELSESRLRLLHAQIEPHFLFNTLGAVQQLAEKEAPRAAELTANLIAFLRASLGEMRSERVTLATDFDMIEAYLKVMTVRQGERLRFTLSLPAQLTGREVPSMMLLTLVENAIKHGIEPSLRGGEIRIDAQQAGGMLVLSVRDTGAGLAEQPGSGDGLANVRNRLQLLYGGAARLDVRDADDGGVLAEISIPVHS
jgi:sensor histidine kinase YesM